MLRKSKKANACNQGMSIEKFDCRIDQSQSKWSIVAKFRLENINQGTYEKTQTGLNAGQRNAVDFGICALKVSWSDNRNRSKPIEDLHSFKLWLTLIALTITSINFDWFDRSLRLTSIDFKLRSVRLTSPGCKNSVICRGYAENFWNWPRLHVRANFLEIGELCIFP